MEKRLYVLGIVIVLMLSTYSPVHAKNFLSLKVGQTLTFDVADDQGHTWEMSYYVSGTARMKCPNKSYFIVEGFSVDTPEDWEINIVRSTRDKLYGYTGACSETMLYMNGLPGTTWTYEGGRLERTIEAIETVTVAAGTFKNCLRIRQRNLDNDCLDMIEWFEPNGLGTVKEIDYYCENPTKVRMTKELKSYTK